MADLAVTAASVAAGSGNQVTAGTATLAGTTITAGEVVYVDGSNTWQLAKADTAVHAAAKGIALHGTLAGQPLAVQTSGIITIGATVVAGTPYYVSGNNAGGIMGIGDFTTGQYITPLGFAISTTQIQLGINPTGITHA